MDTDIILDRRQNRWTTEQRLFLCCMKRFFHKENEAFSKIFSSSFAAELRQSGYTTGIAWTVLNSQWDTMRRSGDYLWGAVHLAPFIKDGNGTWYPIIRKITHIAQRLGIDLVEKDEDDIDTSEYIPQPPKDRGSATTNGDTTRPEPQAEQEHQHSQAAAPVADQTAQNQDAPNPNALNQEVPILVTAGGKMCLFCFQEGNMHPDLLQSPADEIPPLLYRWSNADSQGVNSRRLFQAGLFAEGTEYFHPNEVSQEEFNKHVENHLRIQKSVTPFISTFKMMLAPIHRALRNEEGAIVSIIDRRKLPTPVYYAKNMIRTLNLRFRWYCGAAEYLVWGSIPKSAIICSFKATTLLRIARENPKVEDLLQFDNISSSPRCGKTLHRVLGSGPGRLDHETGATIGRFLFQLGVPYENCQAVSYGMYNSWWMKRGAGNLEEFYRGVEDGYYAFDQHLTPPPGMAGTGDEKMPDDDISEMPEDSDSELTDNQILQTFDESPELLVNCQIPRVFQTSHQGSELSDMADVFDVFEGPGLPGLPEQLIEAHQSDDETVTNDDPRTSIDLFSIPSSPSPSPSPPRPRPAVIRLFDGATKQWIAQQNSDASSEPPGSSAETAISVNSDDEFDMIFSECFSECKSESSVFGSSPPAALNELRLIPDEKPILALKDDNQSGSRFPATPINPRDRYPVASIPRDRFAADRERVLHFWR